MMASVNVAWLSRLKSPDQREVRRAAMTRSTRSWTDTSPWKVDPGWLWFSWDQRKRRDRKQKQNNSHSDWKFGPWLYLEISSLHDNKSNYSYFLASKTKNSHRRKCWSYTVRTFVEKQILYLIAADFQSFANITLARILGWSMWWKSDQSSVRPERCPLLLRR